MVHKPDFWQVLSSHIQLSTSEYQSITAYQISKQGLEILLTADQKLKDQVDSFIQRDGKLFQVSFEGNDFILKAGDYQCILRGVDWRIVGVTMFI